MKDILQFLAWVLEGTARGGVLFAVSAVKITRLVLIVLVCLAAVPFSALAGAAFIACAVVLSPLLLLK